MACIQQYKSKSSSFPTQCIVCVLYQGCFVSAHHMTHIFVTVFRSPQHTTTQNYKWSLALHIHHLMSNNIHGYHFDSNILRNNFKHVSRCNISIICLQYQHTQLLLSLYYSKHWFKSLSWELYSVFSVVKCKRSEVFFIECGTYR